MATDKKFDLEGFSVDENNTCVAALFEGALVGNTDGVSGGQSTSYTSSGAIDVNDTVSIISASSPIVFTLADGIIAGQEIMIAGGVASGVNTITITPDNLAAGDTITLDDNLEFAKLIWLGTTWFAYNTDGVIA